jgi:uncharacterized membrane protein YgcG
MKVVFTQLQQQLGGALLPIFERFTSFLVNSVFPALQRLGDKVIPPIARALAVVGDFIVMKLVPIFRDRLIPFIQRLADLISTHVVPIVRDLFVKSFERLAQIFDIVATKIRENRDNIAIYFGAVRDLGRFILTTIGPILVKTLGFAFSVVAKAIGPALDAVFGFMGVLGKLGSFVVGIAESVVKTIVGMVNGVIDLINKAINLANKVPGVNIDPLGKVTLTMPSFGGAPTVPGRGSGDLQDGAAAGISSGAPSFSLPDMGIPALGGGSGGGGGSSGSSRGSGGGGGAPAIALPSLVGIGHTSIGPDNIAESLFDADGNLAASVVNITVNTVTADANLPTLIVESLQQYNLVNGPADFQIAI